MTQARRTVIAITASMTLAVAILTTLVFTVDEASAMELSDYQITPDVGGPDDEVGQADLSLLGTDLSDVNAATPRVGVLVGFDDTAQGGNNTSDACALFDGDGDGLPDVALCFALGGPTMDLVASDGAYSILYDCKDTALDRCFTNGGGGDGSSGTIGSDTDGDGFIDGMSSGCVEVTSITGDPFSAEASHASEQDPNNDTYVACDLYLNEVTELNGDVFTGLSLANVCTFPSSSANSDDKDCLVNPGARFVSVEATVTNSETVVSLSASVDGGGSDKDNDSFTTQGGTENTGSSQAMTVGSGEDVTTYNVSLTADVPIESSTITCFNELDGTEPAQDGSALTMGPGTRYVCEATLEISEATSYALEDSGLGEGATCEATTNVDRLPRMTVNPNDITAETVVYTSTFDNADSLWKILSGSWSVEDGVFKQLNDCGFDYTALLKTAPLANYRFSVDVKDLAGTNHGGVVVGQSHEDTRSGAWLVDLTNGGSTLRWGTYNETGYYQNTGSVDIAAPAAGQFVNITVTVLDNNITIEYEGTEVASLPTTTGDGHVGLVSTQTAVAYDNVTLTALPPGGGS